MAVTIDQRIAAELARQRLAGSLFSYQALLELKPIAT